MAGGRHRGRGAPAASTCSSLVPPPGQRGQGFFLTTSTWVHPLSREGGKGPRSPHLSVAGTWGAEKRHRPFQGAASPGRARRHSRAGASSGGSRSAAAPWRAAAALPWALEAAGGGASGQEGPSSCPCLAPICTALAAGVFFSPKGAHLRAAPSP